PKQFLKRIERSGFGQFVFYELRYDENDQPLINSVFSQEPYRNAEILLARENFGCGSSREHAPWALEDYGFRVILAPSFADIFYNNCFNNGLLPIRVDNETMNLLFQNTSKYQGYTLTVDLEQQRINDSFGLDIPFEIDPFHKKKLLLGLDDIGLTLEFEDKISQYEERLR
ncbi:MAG: 3-isopropylmalate dehydratase small subunit, partial [Vallitaleaceae bacterium]|nr:3-isopropylmalate dehydratase small subunit [Vallitaleaceae bacterium]